MLDNLPDISVSVSEFVDLVNEAFDFAFPSIAITGELANLRISKNRWVYFDLKDDDASVRFFGTVQQLPGPLEDGMLLKVRGAPNLHARYGFSVNVQLMTAVGEGSIRRAAELLAAKLQAEGLFEAARKRPLPYPPRHIGLITSTQSAAYADFIKIITARWGGMDVEVVDVQVQGDAAPAQIMGAIGQFNLMAEPPDVLVLIRGGGSADDLAAWSHEGVTRAVAASRVPTMAAIGHEVDTSLSELAADVRASTPSNAAELLTPDKRVVLAGLESAAAEAHQLLLERLTGQGEMLAADRQRLDTYIAGRLQAESQQLDAAAKLLEALSPQAALRRGYAVIRNQQGRPLGGPAAANGARRPALPLPGDIVHIELLRARLRAKVLSAQAVRTARPVGPAAPAPGGS